jgi:hypothetical protein
MKKGERTSRLSSVAIRLDSKNSSSHSGNPRKLDGFPSESLDDFDRNDWMLSIGTGG